MATSLLLKSSELEWKLHSFFTRVSSNGNITLPSIKWAWMETALYLHPRQLKWQHHSSFTRVIYELEWKQQTFFTQEGSNDNITIPLLKSAWMETSPFTLTSLNDNITPPSLKWAWMETSLFLLSSELNGQHLSSFTQVS